MIKMNIFEKVIKGFVVASALMVAGSVFAVPVQGPLGATSLGSFDIDVTVADQIQINGLADITGAYVPGSDFTGTSPACVFRNGGSGDFEVTMSSDNGLVTGEFRLNGPGGFVDYTVEYDDGASGNITMAHATLDNTNFTNANNVLNCASGPIGAISITVPNANLGAVGAGSYQDTLTILVAPR